MIYFALKTIVLAAAGPTPTAKSIREAATPPAAPASAPAPTNTPPDDQSQPDEAEEAPAANPPAPAADDLPLLESRAFIVWALDAQQIIYDAIGLDSEDKIAAVQWLRESADKLERMARP